MAFSRFVDGLNWVKDKAKKVYRALPAVAKVTAMMGGAVFNADKFAAWVLRAPSGLSTPLGISLAIVLTIGVGVDNIIGRAFNIYRREDSGTPQLTPVPAVSSLDDLTAEPQLTALEIARKATFWSPHIDPGSCTKDIGYKLFQLHCALYMINSGMGGFLSEFSLAQLIAKIPGLEFDSTCSEEESDYSKIILVHLAALYCSYSSILSFLKYNLVCAREYYIYYVIQDHWRDIGLLSYLETFAGVGVNTIGIIFNNKHTWELLEKNSLCHIGAMPVPTELIQAQSWKACTVNFVVTAGTTLPAVHKRHMNIIARELDALLEDVPACKPWNQFIRLCNRIAGLSAAVGAVIATAKLPETVNNDLEGLSYEWWMIALGVLSAVIALKNQLALSYEAYAKQLEVWAKDNKTANNVANPALRVPLLIEREISIAGNPQVNPVTAAHLMGHDHVININHADTSVYAEPNIQTPPRQTKEKVSVAPSSSLFGVNNPANRNAAQKKVGRNDATIEPPPLLAATENNQSICVVM